MSDGNDLTLGYMMGSSENNGNNGGDFGFGGGGWGGLLGLIVVASLFGWGGMGGGFGGGWGGAGIQGMATRADINEGFALNNITGGITAIQQGICDSTYALNNAITSGFHGVDRGLCDLGYRLADCCCQTGRAIDGVNYNMASQFAALNNNLCGISRDLIENQNANTRSILDFLVNDKISTLTAENQSLKFAASQAQQNAFITANQEAQTAELIRRLGPTPVPAYQVPAPYPYCGHGQCNCGC